MLALVFALALIAAACGDDDGDSGGGGGFFGGNGNGTTDNGGNGGSEGSDDDVLAALGSLQGSGYGMTIGLDMSGADLAATMTAMGETVGPEDEAVFDLLAGAQMSFAGTDDAAEFVLTLDGSTVFEVLAIGTTVYLRMDLDGLVDVAESIEPGAGAQVQGMAQMGPFFAMEDPQLAFIGDFLAGGWVSLEVPESTPFDDEFGINPSAATDIDPDELLAAFEEVLRGDVEISSIGDERYLVEVDVESALRSLAENPDLAELMELDPAEIDEMLAEARAEGVATTWSFEVGLNGGELESIRMDVLTLADDTPDGASLPILITFTPGAEPRSAPSDATPIPPELLTDPSALEGMLGGM